VTVAPSAYHAGFAKAAQVDAALAARYLHYTTVGDEPADALIAQIYGDPRGHHWIQLGIDGDVAALADAPDGVRSFFEHRDVSRRLCGSCAY
jgi:hypothetical protein